MILMTLFAAFSFLVPDAGRLAGEMGFVDYNPAAHKNGRAIFMGELSTLDSKKAIVCIAKKNVFLRAEYINFGELVVRGEVPDDEGAVSVFPYLFNGEIGTWKRFGRTSLGFSLSFYEQRVMEYYISGYYLSMGVIHKVKSFNIQGFVRNIGGRTGYIEREKYPLPVFAFAGLSHSSRNSRIALGSVFGYFSPKSLLFSLVYGRRIYKELWLGAEVLPEKDFSFGYRERYPLRFMMRVAKGNISLGYEVKVPKGALGFKHSLYCGVRI